MTTAHVTASITVAEATENYRRAVELERRRYEQSICEDCEHVKDFCRCEES